MIKDSVLRVLRVAGESGLYARLPLFVLLWTSIYYCSVNEEDACSLSLVGPGKIVTKPIRVISPQQKTQVSHI